MDRERLGQLVAKAVEELSELELASVIDPVNAESLRRERAENESLRYRLDYLQRHTLRRYLEDGCAICGTLRDRWDNLPARGVMLASHAEVCFRNRLSYITNDRRQEGPFEGYWRGELLRLCQSCMHYLLASVAEYLEESSHERSAAKFLDKVGRLLPRQTVSIRQVREARDVYFAEADGVPQLVKIGMSVSAEDRLSQLGLRPILIEPGGAHRERLLHQRFADLRVPPETLPAEIPADGRTEWFMRRGPLAHYLTIASAA